MLRPIGRVLVLRGALALALASLTIGAWLFFVAGAVHLIATGFAMLVFAGTTRALWKRPASPSQS